MVIKKGKNIPLLFFIAFFFVFLALSTVDAAHYIIGSVADSYDGELADSHTILLWNSANGNNDNLTDIIGPSGNSGASNTYMIDCELLNSACAVGDNLSIEVIDNGNGYISGIVNVIVTGSGYDLSPNLRLNSFPIVNLITPINYQNISGMIAFNCSVNDSDGNLDNVTLFGNWSGQFIANETKSLTGYLNSTIFYKNLSDGVYSWNCLSIDDLNTKNSATTNNTVVSDSTPPAIISVVENLTSICGNNGYIRINCTVQDSISGLSNVIIQAENNNNFQNFTTINLLGNTYYSDIYLNQVGNWSFTCFANDSASNLNYSIANDINISGFLADLRIQSSNIIFSNLIPIENQPVVVNVTVENIGCSDANNVLTGFYVGDYSLGGLQIGTNQTSNISAYTNQTINITWNAAIGKTNIFVLADVNSSILDINKSNNFANNTINVSSWELFYGNITASRLLANSGNENMTFWGNLSNLSGNVYVTDSVSVVSWTNLYAIGENTSGNMTSNDFSEIDQLFNSSNFTDSIQNVFTTNGYVPRNTMNFTVHKSVVKDVPVINSTNNSNFFTGIMWDASGDINNLGQFSKMDNETLVFISNINQQKKGLYGINDYEINIPVRLRQYRGSNFKNINFYFDLN